MDISNWSPEEILTLPDHLLGRRWNIGVAHYFDDGLVHYALSRAPLPEWTIFYNYWLVVNATLACQVHQSMRLLDHLPTTDTEFYQGELVFKQANRMAQSDFVHYANDREPFHMSMRDLVHTAGRRICIRSLRTGGSATVIVGSYYEIASLPKTIPEWFH